MRLLSFVSRERAKTIQNGSNALDQVISTVQKTYLRAPVDLTEI